MSACRACNAVFVQSRDPCLLHRMGVHGAPGQPDATLEEDGGAPARGRGVQQHATSRMLLESCIGTTGDVGGGGRGGESAGGWGKMGAKVPSGRASGPRGMHGGAGEMGTAASWLSMENDQR